MCARVFSKVLKGQYDGRGQAVQETPSRGPTRASVTPLQGPGLSSALAARTRTARTMRVAGLIR